MKKDKDLLYKYYYLTQFVKATSNRLPPVLPEHYGKWVEGDPWYGPLVKSDYSDIEREIMLDKIILNKLKNDENRRKA